MPDEKNLPDVLRHVFGPAQVHVLETPEDVEKLFTSPPAAPTRRLHLVPKGLETPAGLERTHAALADWNNSAHEVGNNLKIFLLNWKDLLQGLAAYATNTERPCFEEDLATLCKLVEERDQKQGVFLKAIAGEPQ